jgi:hypothetical protein
MEPIMHMSAASHLVIDELDLDRLHRRDSQDRLRNSGTKAAQQPGAKVKSKILGRFFRHLVQHERFHESN